MRRNRVMSKEEQLLRETVRRLVQEVSTDDVIQGVGIASDVAGLALNPASKVYKPAVALNLLADFGSLMTSFVMWSRMKARREDFHRSPAMNKLHSDEPQTWELFAKEVETRYQLSVFILLITAAAIIPSVLDTVDYSPASSVAEAALKTVKWVMTFLQLSDDVGFEKWTYDSVTRWMGTYDKKYPALRMKELAPKTADFVTKNIPALQDVLRREGHGDLADDLGELPDAVREHLEWLKTQPG